MTAVLVLVGGVAVGSLLTAVMLLAPEYLLFVYGLSLGFPDLAVMLGGIINLRADDLAILLLFVRMLVTLEPLPITRTQKQITLLYLLFFGYCLVSAGFATFFNNETDSYFLVRMVGGTGLFCVLVVSVDSMRAFRFLALGIMAGGIALVGQVAWNFQGIALQSLTRSSDLKSLASFETWNPNTIGQAGLLFTFVAGLLLSVTARPAKTALFFLSLLLAVFAMLPMAIFARGASISILCGWALYLLLNRNWKLMLAVLLFASFAYAGFYQIAGNLIDTATKVDIATGQGFSSRYDLWQIARELIEQKPLLGHGFGQETRVYREVRGNGMTHDAYLSIWLELGIAGLSLFLYFLFSYLRPAVRRFLGGKNRAGYAVFLSFLLALCIESISGMGLYGEKFITVALAVLCISLGILEKNAAVPVEGECFYG